MQLLRELFIAVIAILHAKIEAQPQFCSARAQRFKVDRLLAVLLEYLNLLTLVAQPIPDWPDCGLQP